MAGHLLPARNVEARLLGAPDRVRPIAMLQFWHRVERTGERALDTGESAGDRREEAYEKAPGRDAEFSTMPAAP